MILTNSHAQVHERRVPVKSVYHKNSSQHKEFHQRGQNLEETWSLKMSFFSQDAGLYVCGARNAMNKDGDKGKGVVYLNTEKGEREWLDQIVQGKKIPQSLKLYISLTDIFLMNL